MAFDRITIPVAAGADQATGVTFKSLEGDLDGLVSTLNQTIIYGTGAPTLSARAGTLFLRSDGSASNNRLYISTGGTTWTALLTVT